MPNKMIIHVDDFEGEYTNPSDCPVARSLKKLGFEGVSVGPKDVDFLVGDERVCYSFDGKTVIRNVDEKIPFDLTLTEMKR